MKGGYGLDRTCDGCGCLEIEPAATRYGYYLACCTDRDKPERLGARRVVGTAQERAPFRIPTPVWCRLSSADAREEGDARGISRG